MYRDMSKNLNFIAFILCTASLSTAYASQDVPMGERTESATHSFDQTSNSNPNDLDNPDDQFEDIIFNGFELLPETQNNHRTAMTTRLDPRIENKFIEAGYDLLKKLYSFEGVSIENEDLKDIFDSYITKNKNKLAQKSVVGYTNPSSWMRSSLNKIWSKTYTDKRHNYLYAIASILWAIADMGVKKGENFHSGSYTIIDPEHRLARFLTEYVSLVTGHKDPKHLAYSTTWSDSAYRRDPRYYGSSHHKNHCLNSQFGIDARLNSGDFALKIFPGDRSHVLFAEITLDDNQKEDLTFIKIEDVGIGNSIDMINHGWSFLKTHGDLNDQNKRKEKMILPVIKEAYKNLLALLGDGDMPKGTTIRDIYLKAIDVIESSLGDATIQNQASEIIKIIHETYPKDDKCHHLRTGHEVIIDMREPRP